MRKTLLITGANRGLGLELSRILSIQDHYEIVATARDEINLKAVLARAKIRARTYSYDLISIPQDQLIQMLTEIQPDVIVNCASPYTRKTLLQMTPSEIQEYYHCAQIDTVLTHTFLNQCRIEKKSGTLIHTGAIIGMPNFHSRGLIGMLKSNQRELSATAHEEVKALEPPVYVRYMNLGSFRDEVEAGHEARFLSTQAVAECIADIIAQPENYSPEFTLVSDEDLLNYAAFNLRRSEQPEKKTREFVM